MSTHPEHITLPAWAVTIVNRKGYMERYYWHRAEGSNSRTAYELVEGELETYFESHRYTSFESFQTSLKTWRKKQVKQQK